MKCKHCKKGDCNTHIKRKLSKYSVVERYARKLDEKYQSQIAWQHLHKTKKLPKTFPSTPSIAYRKEWKSWNHFFGKEYATYWQSKALAKKFKVKSAIEWADLLKFHKSRIKYPTHPQRHYNIEWTNWKKFLPPKNQKFRSYKSAQRWAIKNDIQSSLVWRDLYRKKELPIDIPAKPEEHYKGKGWVDWKTFLNTDFYPFRVCKALARHSGIKNSSEWAMAHSQGLFPDKVPATPNLVFSVPKSKRIGGKAKPWRIK